MVAIAGFAFAAEPLGFAVATVWLLVVDSLAYRESRWREIVFFAFVMRLVGGQKSLSGSPAMAAGAPAGE